MSQDEVNRTMGTGSETVVEKVYHEGCLSGYRKLEVAKPYKTEIRKVNDETYEVLRYPTIEAEWTRGVMRDIIKK